jgi:hypothetical protein
MLKIGKLREKIEFKTTIMHNFQVFNFFCVFSLKISGKEGSMIAQTEFGE